MRAGIVASCIALAVSLSACNDVTLVREGIGTNLAPADLTEVSRLQDAYIGEICRQAGLRYTRNGDFLYCEEVGMRPSEWMTFVQAGMNDIDRRCDAYLAWLDNKRRSQEPILKQLHTTAATTAAIMGLTGVDAVPIAIVAAAFGFAQDTFVNISSRLLTEIDHSVVQAVVLDNQNRFRVKVAQTPVDNRPAAIYLLRNYLRICMPFSIEMSINNTMTVYSRGGSDGLRSEPLLTRPPTVARVTAIRDVNAPMERVRVPQTIVSTRIGKFEEGMGNTDMRTALKILCRPDTEPDLGVRGSPARTKLASVLKDNGLLVTDRVTTTNFTDLRELSAMGKVTCP